jgi:putative endonuclease
VGNANIRRGKEGEELALKFLKKNGYRIVERNYRCRYGEIDIIARDGAVLVFVEVKARASGAFGLPAESVDARKQRHIINASTEYLAKNGLTDTPARFDVVSIEMGGGDASMELIRNAFDAC